MGEERPSNGINGHDGGGLKVVVIGAGIGGLAAATFLRQQGHQVDIYESSKFATELGAAIHIPPNACGLLKRIGINPADVGANLCTGVSMYTSGAHKIMQTDNSAHADLWQHPWTLGHRVRLHTALKDAALAAGAVLHLATPIVSIDAQSGSVTTKDGAEILADVIVGADGVHSVSRATVNPLQKPFGSGKSAFRFLIPRQAVLDDPQTRPYAERDGELVMAYHRDRRLVMYPTSDNTLLNFVCIHPEAETASSSTGKWDNRSTRETLLNVFAEFHEDFKAILSKVDESSLKIWRLLDMDVLESWTIDRLALMGDAAHPFLPHQGQGGAIALEDAAALGVVLERGLKSEEVSDRLKLYQQIRKARADRLQQYTRLAGEDLKPGEPTKLNMMEYMGYNFGHDEYDNSTQKLREWKWSNQPASYRRMPIVFGPMPGPRQTYTGQRRDGTQSTFVTASIKIKTSRTVLQNLFPPGSTAWKFKSPGSVAYCSFSQTTLNGMEWLGGQGYNHLGLYIHGVECQGEGGKATSGVYMPVLFENLADPIVSGREELGMPKVFSEIDVDHSEISYSINAAWRGHVWGNFELSGLREAGGDGGVTGKMTGDDADEGILVQRYIPKVGTEFRGQAEADYAVFDPFAAADPKPKVKRVWEAGNATFTLNAGSWKTLPTLHHIVSRLAEIPVYEVVAAKVVEGTGVPDVSTARRISG